MCRGLCTCIEIRYLGYRVCLLEFYENGSGWDSSPQSIYCAALLLQVVGFLVFTSTVAVTTSVVSMTLPGDLCDKYHYKYI